ncbi:hypothetical protein VNO80_19221 [Phaseolus coccineus]|uniref:Uncharacterized protein n=1 Tax=Phaseolus coccineus TaxID=3886 RepID=A0AAN9MJ44_PHACN
MSNGTLRCVIRPQERQDLSMLEVRVVARANRDACLSWGNPSLHSIIVFASIAPESADQRSEYQPLTARGGLVKRPNAICLLLLFALVHLVYNAEGLLRIPPTTDLMKGNTLIHKQAMPTSVTCAFVSLSVVSTGCFRAARLTPIRISSSKVPYPYARIIE